MNGSGLVYVALSAFTFSIISTLAKLTGLPSFQILFLRSIISGFLNFMGLACVHHNVDGMWGEKADRPLLFARAAFGIFALSSLYFAINHMALADASALVFTSPVFTFFAGAYFLHEPVALLDLGAGLLCLSGVVMVARPSFLFGHAHDDVETTSGSRVVAVFVALCCALGQTGAYVCIKRLKHVHYAVITNYFMVSAAIVSPIFFPVQHPRWDQDTKVWVYICIIGVFGFVGQIFLVKGMQLTRNVGTASVMRYLDVVFVFIWDTLWVREPVSGWSYAGASLITLCALIVVFNNVKRQESGGQEIGAEKGLASSFTAVGGKRCLKQHMYSPLGSSNMPVGMEGLLDDGEGDDVYFALQSGNDDDDGCGGQTVML